MMNQAAFSDVYLDLGRIGELRSAAARESPEALEAVAKQFEGIFLKMVLKSMREASFGDPLFDTESSGLYRDLYDHQLALELSKGRGLGIADMLVRQLRGFLPGAAEDAAEGDKAPLSDAEALQRNPALLAVRPAPGGEVHEPEFSSKESFLQTLGGLATRTAKALGVDPLLMLAQSALETGWGQHILRRPDGTSSHNLFGIKAGGRWDGDRVSAGTLEYADGVAARQRAQFRSYGSFEESFQDYVALLQGSPRYAEALSRAADPEAFMNGLQQAGYATDPRYAEKVLRIWREELSGAVKFAGALAVK